MSAFSTSKILYADRSEIPRIAEAIREAFISDGFDVRIVDPKIGDEIHITKGGLFKAAVGLRSTLKITMSSTKDGYIHFSAGASVIKQQAIPTLITMCFCQPVVIAQIWGMIKQTKLDDKALSIAEKTIYQK